MSTSELAAVAGISQGGMRQIEDGRVKAPSAIIVLRIARELAVDPYELAFGE
jgi:transcriptional regulator with XRE-family HTH domain